MTAPMHMKKHQARLNGNISHWMSQSEGTVPARPGLDGDITADICIVGGGYSGLWLAYHLSTIMTQANIVVVEKHRVGYGGSGRNAGWLSGLVPGNRKAFSKSAGSRQAGIDLQRRMLDAVDEVLDVIDREQFPASARRSGNLVVARNRAALARLDARRAGDLNWGLNPDEVVRLDQSEVRQRIDASGAIGGLYYPAVGRLDPAGLVAGLARLLESRGVKILEGTEVTHIESGIVRTRRGTITAKKVLRCTEAYSATLGVDPRRIIPVNSSIVVTDPIPDDLWEQIGWSGYECFSDAAHVFSYAQRTDDGRIVIGGRGNPYRFGSNPGSDGVVDQGTIDALTNRLHSFFPVVRQVPIAHAWCGVIGVTRDWCASVDFDEQTGVGWTQGYAGHGVTSAYLASKSLAALVSGQGGSDAELAWVGRQARRWEPEPVRWLGVHGMYRLFALADSWEERRQAEKTSLLARVGSRLAGLHE